MDGESAFQPVGAYRRSRRRLLAAAGAFLLVLAAAGATAVAQEAPEIPSDPGQDCAEATSNAASCDTEYTPVAKNPAQDTWDHVGGARFGEDGELAGGSPTPFTVDFFTVRFESAELGFAGGSACADPDTPFEAVKDCERVPVIYRFLDPDGVGGEQQGEWEEVYRGSTKGYVGSIAFTGLGSAIAVGGTGSYPRRELKRGLDEGDEPYVARDLAGNEPNASGRGLVWTYDGGDWDEVPDLPLTDQGDPMRGLSAIDCSPRLTDGGRCLAGGLRQLWLWQGDGFTKSFTEMSPRAELDPPNSFLFRVRAVRFMPGTETPPVQAVAITSGCCTGNEALDHANTIGFDGDRAFLRPGPGMPVRPTARNPNDPFTASSDATDDAANTARPRDSLASSFYAFNAYPPLTGQNTFRLSVVAAPGGPPPEPASDGLPAAPEPPSRVFTGPGNGFEYDDAQGAASGNGATFGVQAPGVASEAISPSLSTARLVSGDGDFARAQLAANFAPREAPPDGLIDWAVGEQTSTGQGIAFSTVAGPTPLIDAADCPGEVDQIRNAALTETTRVDGLVAATKCQPHGADPVVAGTRSRRLFGLPSYALNGFVFIPGSATAWAVGDRGGLLSFGAGEGQVGGGGSGDEPEPPQLGTPRPAPLPDASPYEGRLPEPQGPAGPVPALALSPEHKLEEPRLVPAGSPDSGRRLAAPREDVTEIVMSRDGNEGWAIGGVPRANNNPGTTLFHFEGDRWTRCETDEVPGVIEPDPACEELSPLRDAQQGGRPAPVPMRVAARVPLERDDDPSNDDEFEVMALGDPVVLPGSNKARVPVARYREGRWAIDRALTDALPDISGNNEVAALVFVRPDDGWLLVKGFVPRLYRFDGDRWLDCHADAAACDAPAGLFPREYGSLRSDDGDLVEVNGRLYVAMTRISGGSQLSQITYPMVAFKDPGGTWSTDPAQGGLDPGCASGSGTTCVGTGETADQGQAVALSVAPAPGGGFTGWLAGTFGSSIAGINTPLSETAPLMRLERTGGAGWVPWKDETTSDYPPRGGQVSVLAMPDAVGDSDAWIVSAAPSALTPPSPLLAFRNERWELAGSPFSTIIRHGHGDTPASAVPQAVAPDGRGGFWLAVRQAGAAISVRGQQVGFYHYTDRVRDRVFEDAPHPVREPIVATAAGGDGSFWVATESNVVYRYSRYTGWDKVAVPGWDPGRVVTRPSEATAIAVGPDGEGLVVGRAGRIAQLSAVGAQLDPVAGSALCGEVTAADACGTGRMLRAVAIGPDGSAMAGGDARTVMWRPAGESFRTVVPPPTAASARITGVSLPQPNRAYVVTDIGQVWAGSPDGGSWKLENRAPSGRLLSVDTSGNPEALHAISLDGEEHGFAVGDGGVILERTGDPDEPWRRLDEGIRDDLYSVAQPPTGGDGALIGGVNGSIYTLSGGRFEVARTSDPWHPLTAAPVTDQETARIIGLALLPGDGPGEVEAWAATKGVSGYGRDPHPQALLRYRSGDTESAPAPSAVEALPDVPAEREGELTLAALGRTDCGLSGACPPTQDSDMFSDTVVRQAREEILARSERTDGPVATVFTGDAAIGAGTGDHSETGLDANVTQHAWAQFVAGGFRDDGLPLFGAVGLRDLTRAQVCNARCAGTADAGVGASGPWRQAMAGMPAPWGDEEQLSEGGVSYVPVDVGGGLDHPDGATSSSGAQTHYALDMVRDDEKLLRLVFADNSLRSLAGSEPNQNPVEPGGQDLWLDAVLCRSGEGAGCTRGASEPAVVVANTPPYSYGPGALEHTASDAATFEQTLLSHEVSGLISGRMGWNGLYYVCAPQLHTPEPGGVYPSAPPQSQSECAGVEDSNELPVEVPDPNELIETGASGILPGVIAGSAGGLFGPNRDDLGSAAQGYWHGYSVVRVPADGDGSGVIVEQRPVFDWIGIRPAPSAPATHVVRAGRKLALEGFGREPASTDIELRYDEITTPAITHRYDLLQADPERPWLPLEAADNGVRTMASTRIAESDPCGPYVCLDPKVGGIDDQSGQVKAGKGNYPRTFAIAALSVGDEAATYPLVFEPRASFKPPAPVPVRPPALPPPPANPTQPPQPGPPAVEALVPPVLPNLTAAQPPAPPVPPTPPPAESQAPLDLNLAPSSLEVNPPTAVSQPPTPPVNPAPPSGARREARQRQAAAQKSGADADVSEGAEETQGSGGDLARAPDSPDQAATRLEHHDFTAVADRRQPSAWTRDALLGGGIGLAALILALGLRTARPTPRRREPEAPAPAWSRSRRR